MSCCRVHEANGCVPPPYRSMPRLVGHRHDGLERVAELRDRLADGVVDAGDDLDGVAQEAPCAAAGCPAGAWRRRRRPDAVLLQVTALLVDERELPLDAEGRLRGAVKVDPHPPSESHPVPDSIAGMLEARTLNLTMDFCLEGGEIRSPRRQCHGRHRHDADRGLALRGREPDIDVTFTSLSMRYRPVRRSRRSSRRGRSSSATSTTRTSRSSTTWYATSSPAASTCRGRDPARPDRVVGPQHCRAGRSRSPGARCVRASRSCSAAPRP